MKISIPIAVFLLALSSCTNSPQVRDVEWLIGKWEGEDVNTLLFHENWERGEKGALIGYGWTTKPEGDTLFHESLKIDLVEGVPFYFATLPKSKEPVLFKLTQGDAHHAIFENRDHDFPQVISYILETNNTMTVKLEGIEKGQPRTEELQFERNTGVPLIHFKDSIPDSTAPPLNIQIH